MSKRHTAYCSRSIESPICITGALGTEVLSRVTEPIGVEHVFTAICLILIPKQNNKIPLLDNMVEPHATSWIAEHMENFDVYSAQLFNLRSHEHILPPPCWRLLLDPQDDLYPVEMRVMPWRALTTPGRVYASGLVTASREGSMVHVSLSPTGVPPAMLLATLPRDSLIGLRVSLDIVEPDCLWLSDATPFNAIRDAFYQSGGWRYIRLVAESLAGAVAMIPLLGPTIKLEDLLRTATAMGNLVLRFKFSATGRSSHIEMTPLVPETLRGLGSDPPRSAAIGLLPVEGTGEVATAMVSIPNGVSSVPSAPPLRSTPHDPRALKFAGDGDPWRTEPLPSPSQEGLCLCNGEPALSS
jgi:hypothetical protein